MIILSLVKLSFFILFFLYIPAKAVFRLVNIDFEDILIESGLALVFGITFVTLLSLVIRYTGVNLSLVWMLPIISAFYLIFNFNLNNIRDKLGLRKTREKIDLRYVFVLLTILLGTAAQSTVLFLGGIKIPGGFAFPSLHDTMWNIALSAELFHHFPPENPAIAGVLLKNNHYFYPFFLAITRYFTGGGIFDLYYRFGPVLVSAVFGTGLYAVSSIFIKNIYFRILAVFLGYFSGNFAYILPLILGSKFDWKGNTFFADQPFDQLMNPYSVLGFAFMLFGIYCLSHIAVSQRKSFWGYSIIGAVLFGSLYGFKSFGGIIVIFTLIISTILYTVLYRRIHFIPITLSSIILFLLIFLSTTDLGKASVIWAPGWLLTQLMTDRDKLNLPRFADLESYYKSTSNILGFGKIKIIELTVYFLGNLGTRLAGLIYLFIILLRKIFTKEEKHSYTLWFIFFAVVSSLLIPLFFNLRNSTFNIIQFTPYALVLLSIISVLFLEKIYSFLESNGQKYLGIIMIFSFVILSIPVNIKNFLGKTEIPKDTITNEETTALNFLRTETKPDDIILINPQQFFQDPIYVPALSERRVYLASPGYASQTGIDPKSRMRAVTNFFKVGGREFLVRSKAAYIYLLKPNFLGNDAEILRSMGAKSIFENNGVIILKTI